MEVLQDQNQKKKNPRQIGNAYFGHLQQLRFPGAVPSCLPRMRLLPWQASDGNQYGQGLICFKRDSVHAGRAFFLDSERIGEKVVSVWAECLFA